MDASSIFGFLVATGEWATIAKLVATALIIAAAVVLVHRLGER